MEPIDGLQRDLVVTTSAPSSALPRQGDVVVVDVGGTNVRFAVADLADGRIELGDVLRYATGAHSSLAAAWRHFADEHGRPLPSAASVAIAGGLGGETVKLANSPWVVRPATLAAELGVGQLTLVNDFGAMAHAVDSLNADQLELIGGPAAPWPVRDGAVSVIGPGTGLGVAMLLRHGGVGHVIETEGGHIDFAPLDQLEEKILARLRARHLRVSVERIVSGPGLANVHEALAEIEGVPAMIRSDAALWAEALSGDDALAAAALDRWCLSFGSFVGDAALIQGASAVVLTGQLSQRIADRLCAGPFLERFRNKGRYRVRMEAIPIYLCRHPEPGLYGAAAAFKKEHRRP